MKARSEAQQKAAGAALAAKRGEQDPDDLQGASREMYDDMSEAELEEMASTSHDDLPKRA
ncbi:Protein of unknwon function [Pseudooceanicola antarcticus]|uniref:DUF3008 domain-containing protein n=1 Tax=Pseudooceanicola antarcticus TaxID=1247613 RepID=A0A285IUP5_9RHOB|nr:DUF3008 family protein [Pseudooceanicola antarcticus]PJE32100.1 DUF3008 domain-containing protein [Pseudooceanicola antarcticus]SNY51553.1 Protein of unknwon function [Pseudooceanicola antarcticus]